MKIKGNNLRGACIVIIRLIYFLVMLPIKLCVWIVRVNLKPRVTPAPKTERVAEHVSEPIDCPEFMQFYYECEDLGVGLERVEMCPDETAVIRVVGNDTFSKQYRRRVQTDSKGKYFVLNKNKYYIKQTATKPFVPENKKKQ